MVGRSVDSDGRSVGRKRNWRKITTVKRTTISRQQLPRWLQKCPRHYLASTGRWVCLIEIYHPLFSWRIMYFFRLPFQVFWKGGFEARQNRVYTACSPTVLGTFGTGIVRKGGCVSPSDVENLINDCSFLCFLQKAHLGMSNVHSQCCTKYLCLYYHLLGMYY